MAGCHDAPKATRSQSETWERAETAKSQGTIQREGSVSEATKRIDCLCLPSGGTGPVLGRAKSKADCRNTTNKKERKGSALSVFLLG